MDITAQRRVTPVQFIAAFFAWIASPLLLTGLFYLVSMILFAIASKSEEDIRLEYYAPLVVLAALICWVIGPLVLALVLRTRVSGMGRHHVWRIVLGWLLGMIIGAAFTTYQIFHIIFYGELNPGLSGQALGQYINFTTASIPVVLLILWVACALNMVFAIRSADPNLPRKDLWLTPLLWGVTFAILGFFLFRSELSLMMRSAQDYVEFQLHWFLFLQSSLMAVTAAWGIFGGLCSLWLFFRLNHVFKQRTPAGKASRARIPRVSSAD